MRHDPEKEKQYKKELLEMLSQMAADKRQLSDFLHDILTPAEYREIATRWQIVKKLADQEGHRTIASELGIGVSTVNRGSRMLLNPQGGFNQALRKAK